jgi:hypothetical protein
MLMLIPKLKLLYRKAMESQWMARAGCPYAAYRMQGAYVLLARQASPFAYRKVNAAI